MEGGDEIETLKRKYREFFEFQRFEGRYSNKLRDAVETGNFRVTVNMNDLRLLGHDAEYVIFTFLSYILSPIFAMHI